MILPSISIEQNEIIQGLKNNNNIVVDSVAGSGKTTSNLHIALYFTQCNILLLTYNAKLKKETRERVKQLGLTNLETHSYHSFCVKNYDSTCFTDTGIISILRSKIMNKTPFKYDIIILDEGQDISPLYYELVCKIYNDNEGTAKICVLGDKFQSIFDFNKADQRFITFSPELFAFNEFSWVKCNLPRSFRITKEMSLFINNCMLGDDRIISNKITHIKPRYIICDCFGDRTFEEIKYYLGLGYKHNEIFILAPSVKNINSPIIKLENKIKKELEIPVYVPTGDDEKLDGDVLEGKLVFSTFHQAKGLERKIIIVFNFDNSYFEFYKKNKNPFVCPNELYVATTRSLEHLTLFHHNSFDYLPFLCRDKLQLYCNIEIHDRIVIKETTSINIQPTSPTEMIKHLPQEVIDHCFEYFETITIREPREMINIPLKTKQDYGNGNNGYESVSEITGIAIPSYFEYILKGKMNILNNIPYKKPKNSNSNCVIQLDEEYIEKDSEHDIILQNLNLKTITPQELLYISNAWNSVKNKLLFKIFQITNYDWLSKDNLNKCIERIKTLNISKESYFEYKSEVKNEKELLNKQIVGYFDCVDKNKLYEFKCVQKLEKEHILQLVIYMYLNEKNKEKTKINYNDDNDNDNLNKKISLLMNYNERMNTTEQIKNEYCIGDIIKYRMFVGEESGIIKKIYNNGKIKVESSNKRIENIVKQCIISIVSKKTSQKHIDLQKKITHIENDIKELRKKNQVFENTEYYLYNILTDEMIQVKSNLEKLIKMVEHLFYSKYISSNEITDNEFLTNITTIKNNYF